MALRGFIGVGSERIQNDVILSRRGGARFFEAPYVDASIMLSRHGRRAPTARLGRQAQILNST